MPPRRVAPRRSRAQAAAWRRLGYNTPGSRPSHLQHDSQAAQRTMQKGLGRGQTANPLGRPGNGNSGPKLPTRSQRRAQAKSGSAQRGHVRLLCLLDILREPRTSSVPAGLQKKTPRHTAPRGFEPHAGLPEQGWGLGGDAPPAPPRASQPAAAPLSAARGLFPQPASNRFRPRRAPSAAMRALKASRGRCSCDL